SICQTQFARLRPARLPNPAKMNTSKIQANPKNQGVSGFFTGDWTASRAKSRLLCESVRARGLVLRGLTIDPDHRVERRFG
ncbi:MAG: hypothetical protein WCF81_09400, partial [Roseiarcus sp.]